MLCFSGTIAANVKEFPILTNIFIIVIILVVKKVALCNIHYIKPH